MAVDIDFYDKYSNPITESDLNDTLGVGGGLHE